MKFRVTIYLVVIISTIIYYQINRSEIKQLDSFDQSFQIAERRLGELFYQLQAIQYGMSQLSVSDAELIDDNQLNFTYADDDICQIAKNPTPEQMYTFETNFLVVSDKAGCEAGTVLHHKIKETIKIAPMMTFLAGRSSDVISLYFISMDKFVITSPKYNGLVLKRSGFERELFTRPYMQKILNVTVDDLGNRIFITGPYADVNLNKQVLTFSIAIFMDNSFYGVLNMDILWEVLVAGINSDFDIINDANPSADLGVLSEPLSYDGFTTNLRLVMPDSVSDKLRYLIKNSLIDITFYFVAIVLAGWFLYTLKLRITSKKFATESCHDPLTGLLNRRGFRAELKNIQRHQFYSFMIIDLDNFKHVNDTYGHPVGDDVLIRVTTAIKQQIREQDILLRLGGEEFGLLIAYNKDNKQIDIFERICETVANLPHYSDDIEFYVTMSGGAVTTSSIDQIKSIKSVIKQADELLYTAKIAGKNRVLYADFSSNEPLDV
ncbi:diguanylate cyclase domain-containing protein [Moritella sp. Urea-trap-13]|uniref:diguanylate cyclase domain-containing protein n=1 Tax=Moritella sp. Urea-trap-13 TaxID=2058327 RepID=UPI000C32E7B4|nr:diguanylate cyclase [Moritella sp. Urea-trap-13]PKH06820.1 GGDEF domain-containing protein [Moritella sp. Urea-trap-13]